MHVKNRMHAKCHQSYPTKPLDIIVIWSTVFKRIHSTQVYSLMQAHARAGTHKRRPTHTYSKEHTSVTQAYA